MTSPPLLAYYVDVQRKSCEHCGCAHGLIVHTNPVLVPEVLQRVLDVTNKLDPEENLIAFRTGHLNATVARPKA
jgi:hypothetical protein